MRTAHLLSAGTDLLVSSAHVMRTDPGHLPIFNPEAPRCDLPLKLAAFPFIDGHDTLLG